MAAARRDPGPRGPAAFGARARPPAGSGPGQAAAAEPARSALERPAPEGPAPRTARRRAAPGVADRAAAAAEPGSPAGPGPAHGVSGLRSQGQARGVTGDVLSRCDRPGPPMA